MSLIKWIVLGIVFTICIISAVYAGDLPDVARILKIMTGMEVDEIPEKADLSEASAILRSMTGWKPETPETPSEPFVIPEQFTPETLKGVYFDVYHDGAVWRYDELIFSESDNSENNPCENPNAVSCGNLTVIGLYDYETRWELWTEPEGNIISWTIPGFGIQWLAICKRNADHFQMVWKGSKGDAVVALREGLCSGEFFFFSFADALNFISKQDRR